MHFKYCFFLTSNFHLMKTIFSTIICFIFISNVVNAQRQYTWEEYGIAFNLANDFKEVVNNIEEFTADGDGMSLTIIPFKDGSIDDSDISAYTVAIAASLNLQRVDDLDFIDINGFKGAYAEGVSDGAKIFMMGLIDPNSDTNFFVIITFLDNDENAIDEAVHICKSISKM